MANLIEQAASLRRKGDTTGAEKLYRGAIARDVQPVAACVGLASVLIEQGNPREAGPLCERALREAKGDTDVLLELAPLLWKLRRPEQTLQAYVAALKVNPRIAKAHLNIGCILQQRNLLDQAERAFRTAIRVDPDYAQAHNNLGGLLVKRGRYGEAESAFRSACEKDPGYAEAHYSLAQCLRSEGAFEDAENELRTSLELNPDLVPALRGWAESRKADSPDCKTAKHLRSLLARPGMDDDEAVDIQFALGKIHDDCGEYGTAFQHYRKGNELKYSHSTFEPERFYKLINDTIGFFTSSTIAALRDRGLEDETPVFIVGMPRSGTTLIEQIVASHPQAWGAGELPNIVTTYRTIPELLKRDEEMPACLRGMSPELGQRLAQAYLSFVRSLAPSTALRIVDKMPENYLYLGLIAILFPRARIIHCSRHPLDTALSIYFHTFSQRNSYEDNLRSIGLVYREYRKLMAHWRNTLSLRMLDIVYEEVVARPEEMIRTIIEFLGLPWDERCLAFHATTRPVYTASAAQVRKPIYSKSLGRWKNYEPFLQPVVEALEDREPPREADDALRTAERS